MTCDEVLTDLRARNPDRRFARNATGTAVAVWTGGRWSAVRVRALCAGPADAVAWYSCEPGALDALADGRPLFPQEGWTE